MQQITTISGTAIPLLLDDIDTDRIIPARYLRCVTFEGLGDHAFEDDRQQDPAHSFNKEQHAGASILVSGRNFGCGSSREHAPQSLMRWGIKGIVAESFAEIFFGNCTGLGIPCVTAARADLANVASAVAENPQVSVTLDLVNLSLSYGNLSIPVSMPKSPHEALTSGQWDFLGQLLDNQDAIRERTQAIPYLTGFAKV